MNLNNRLSKLEASLAVTDNTDHAARRRAVIQLLLAQDGNVYVDWVCAMTRHLDKHGLASAQAEIRSTWPAMLAEMPLAVQQRVTTLEDVNTPLPREEWSIRGRFG